MNGYELITTRRSTRKFRPDPVPQEALDKILEAGRHAPSGHNNQTSHLIVIRNREVLDKLNTLAVQEFSKMDVDDSTYVSLASSIRNSKKGGYIFHYNAPVLVIVANKLDYGNAMADSSCAIENMMLMTNELDLGSCWINQIHWLTDNENMLSYLYELGLEKDETVCGSCAIGYADTPDGLPSRTPLERKGNPITYVD